MNTLQMARWLLVVSVIAILIGPIIMVMAAFSANGIFIGGALLIMGALGLYAGMKALKKAADSGNID
jgi:hypothetical protein